MPVVSFQCIDWTMASYNLCIRCKCSCSLPLRSHVSVGKGRESGQPPSNVRHAVPKWSSARLTQLCKSTWQLHPYSKPNSKSLWPNSFQPLWKPWWKGFQKCSQFWLSYFIDAALLVIICVFLKGGKAIAIGIFLISSCCGRRPGHPLKVFC